jgi:hypothetical protein
MPQDERQQMDCATSRTVGEARAMLPHWLPSPLRGGVGGGGPSVIHRATPTLNPSPQGGGRPIVLVASSPDLGLASDSRMEHPPCA